MEPEQSISTGDDGSARADPRLLRNTRRLELYVISAPATIIVAVQTFWPLAMLAGLQARQPVWRTVLGVGLILALTALQLLIFRRGVRVIRAGGYGIGRRTALGAGVALAVLLAALAAVGRAGLVDLRGIGTLAACAATACGALTIADRLRTALLGTVAVLIMTIAAAIPIWAADDRLGLGAAIATGVIGGGSFGVFAAVAVLSIWSSGWMLRVIKEIDRARTVAAELAIAEERLRMSRDLHDVFGRTLAAVAVKSELAEELARRGRTEQSAREMAAVRMLARDTGREIRTLVRGYREADLDRELIGARALLDSAGIRCEIHGDPSVSAPRTASALAWVLREAVTNVIRHSQATVCRITFGDGDPMTMIIDNNGVTGRPDPGDAGGGHGLINIGDRLAEIGGTVEHRRDGATFRLAVRVPHRDDDQHEAGVQR